jgi:hypothetical protein
MISVRALRAPIEGGFGPRRFVAGSNVGNMALGMGLRRSREPLAASYVADRKRDCNEADRGCTKKG